MDSVSEQTFFQTQKIRYLDIHSSYAIIRYRNISGSDNMEDTLFSPVDELLVRNLRRCGHVLYHQTHHCQQDAVLALLAQGAMNQKQIQEHLSIQPGSASELISKLEAKGLVERARDDADRRRVVLTLTEKGQLAAKIHAERPAENLFSVFSQEEKESLVSLLETLLQSWGL